MSFAIQALIRRRRSILSKTLTLIQHVQIEHEYEKPISCFPQFVSSESAAIKSQVRNFVGVDDILVRRLRNEIEYEVDDLPQQKAADEFNGFKVDPRPGHQWIRLGKKFGDFEDIQVEVTMFDGSAPLTEEGTKPGLPGEELQLHITIIVTIFKQGSNRVLELVCSAWPDSLEVQKFFMRQQSTFSTTQPYTTSQPYAAPKFWELDDKLQEALHAFLKDRGIDKSLCVFLHKLMLHKDKSEYIRWLASAQSAVESLPQIAPKWF